MTTERPLSTNCIREKKRVSEELRIFKSVIQVQLADKCFSTFSRIYDPYFMTVEHLANPPFKNMHPEF
jgi:hypothetical protein